MAHDPSVPPVLSSEPVEERKTRDFEEISLSQEPGRARNRMKSFEMNGISGSSSAFGACLAEARRPERLQRLRGASRPSI